jgi:hypothetical protein
MSFPKIKESELKALLDEVATDLSKAFESEKDKLVKAEEIGKADLAKDDAPGEEPDESAAPDASASSDGPPAPAPEEGSESAPAPDASASPDGAPAPDAAMDPAADAAAALTPEALQAEYSKLAPEELDMHIKAALAAKAVVAGAPDASAGAPGAGAPPMGPPDASAPPMAPPAAGPAAGAGAPPSPPMPDDPMALKSELSAGHKKANGGQIKAGSSLGKSESEKATEDKIAALEALVKSQAEDTENLTKAIKHMLEQPLRKAVTSVAHLPKVEAEKAPLTKASINARLKELSMKPDLKKSDRQLINDFYDGRVQADKLAPLFEDYK